jgi:hypothetical protein
MCGLIMTDLSKMKKICLKLWHSLIKINRWHPSSILVVCSMEPCTNRACKTCFITSLFWS